MKIKQEDDESPPREEPPRNAISTQSSETNIKQEEHQHLPEPRSSPAQPPINLKKASRGTLRKLVRLASSTASVDTNHVILQACAGSRAASELLSERRAKDRAGYEQRKVHLANGRASTLASYERQRENGKRRREKRKREAEGREKSRGLSEGVAEESTEFQETMEEEMMSDGVQERQSSTEGIDGGDKMTEAGETVAKIDEHRWDCEICWSIYEALGW